MDDIKYLKCTKCGYKVSEDEFKDLGLSLYFHTKCVEGQVHHFVSLEDIGDMIDLEEKLSGE